MLIMTTTTTVTIPNLSTAAGGGGASALRRPPHQQQQSVKRAFCHSHNNKIVNSVDTVDLNKCHRNVIETTARSNPQRPPSPPTKRNWVLSENFFLLESPKSTWKENRKLNVPGIVIEHATTDEVCEKSKLWPNDQQQMRRRRRCCGDQEEKVDYNNGPHRSARNSLDFRVVAPAGGTGQSVSSFFRGISVKK